MSEPTVIRVKLCGDCGEVASSMDTMCPRCLRHGTLKERYQCLKCRAVLEERTCAVCTERIGIRAGFDAPVASGPTRVLEGDAIPDVAKPEIPPWLAGGVGGAVLGAGAGAVAGMFMGEAALIGGLIGIVPGALVGAFLTGPSRDSR